MGIRRGGRGRGVRNKIYFDVGSDEGCFKIDVFVGGFRVYCKCCGLLKMFLFRYIVM